MMRKHAIVGTLLLGAAVFGMRTPGALADLPADSTYTFTGTISETLVDILPDDSSIWEAASHSREGGIVSKGELVFGAHGLEQIHWESAGITGLLSNSGPDQFELVITSLDNEWFLLLTEVEVTASHDFLTVDGVMTRAGVSALLSIEATNLMHTGGSDETVGGQRSALGGIGPDVTTSRLGLTSGGTGSDDFHYYGMANGIRAFSMASTSCNSGDQVAQWQSGPAGNHPVIGQNMFRLLDGKFEQLGQSWLKHSFCAVSEFTCGACQPTSCSTLGIGCADTYWATLNDGASGGPKSLINPQGQGSGGTHNNHNWSPASGPTAIRGRLQIHDADINAGGQNFAEVQYITHDEDLDRRHNNASWREVNLNLTSITGVGSGQASMHFMEPAIMAWPDNDANASVKGVIVPGGGKFNIGFAATDNGDGTWHYEYALHNMNSDRCAGSFTIPIPAGVTVTNIGFHDVDYHSGEPFSGTNWATEMKGEGNRTLTWFTQSFDQNIFANAIRWGTLYNFRFDAASAPQAASATIGLFKPGTPETLAVNVKGPEELMVCVGDLNGDGLVDAADLAQMLGAWGPNPGNPADLNESGEVDADDLAMLLGAWGPCP